MLNPCRPSLSRPCRFAFFGAVVIAALAAGSFSGASGVSEGRRHLEDAREDVESARELLGQRRYDGARRHLVSARGHIAAARNDADRISLRAISVAPVLGSGGRALRAAARAGDQLVDAGEILVEEVEALEQAVAKGDGHSLKAVHEATARAVRALDDTAARLRRAERALSGPAGAFLPAVSQPARSMISHLDDHLAELARVRRGLALAGELTDAQSDIRLLVLSQDTMELRPTGGFIGSFGVLRIAGGSVELERYESYEALPPASPPLNTPDDLAAALEYPWNLANANWWPDFPTSARAARELFLRQGGGEVDGVMALTEQTMARLIGVLEPVKLPSYPDPVVEDRFGPRVLWEVELKRPRDEPRKKFLAELADAVLGRLLGAGDRAPEILDAIAASAGSGDLQLWFADPARQAVVEGTVVAGTLPRTNGDFLLLSEANMSANKANADLVKDVDYTVRRDVEGRLRARLRIVYRNNGEPSPVNPYYHGWLKVYVPRGARPLAGTAVQRRQADDGPYDVFFTTVYVAPKGTAEVRIDYLLPDRVLDDGEYRLTWLRQAGTPADHLRAGAGDTTVTGDPTRRLLELSARL